MRGFIAIHRKLMENPIWCDSNYVKLWMYCLFKASHKDHPLLVGNQMVELKRGQFVTGRKTLGQEMNKGVKPDQVLSDKTWMRYLKNLEKWQMLTINVSTNFSVVTIDKYDFYQTPQSELVQVVVPTVSNPCPTLVQPLSTNNNVNKDNKGNNDQDKYISAFDEFWNLYPRKEKKKPSYESFLKVLKQKTKVDGKMEPITIEMIMNGLNTYLKHLEIQGIDKQYYKLCTTFLNQHSFLDEFDLQPRGNINGRIKAAKDYAKQNGIDF